MTSKRRADTDLNHDNWDREDDNSDEESTTGPFKKASEEELAKRKIKVARRRSDVTTGGREGPSLFKNFSAFGNTGASTPGKDISFDFGAKKSDSFVNSNKSSFFSFGNSVGDTGQSAEKKLFEATSFKVPASVATSSATISNAFTFTSTSSSGGVGVTASNTFCNKENSEPSTVNGSNDTRSSTSSEGNNTAYLAKLRALNEGVLKWIQKHLDEHININLNPVFDDYRKHFEELQKRYNPKFLKTSKESAGDLNSAMICDVASEKMSFFPSSNDLSTPTSSSKSVTQFNQSPKAIDSVKSIPSIFGSTETKSNDMAKFSFVSTDLKPLESSTKLPFLTSEPPKFSFGNSESKPKDSVSTFSFGSSTSTQPKEASGFSFGGSTGPMTFGAKDVSSPGKASGFSFASGNSGFSFAGAGGFNPKPLTGLPAAGVTADDAEDDAPPKPEVVEVKEDDAVYDKKCKLFYKKNGVFTDKGVGTLFLKPVPDTEKTQLLVRAATNLGNVLLNILLNPKMPAQRMGKNNVLIVCVPNPPLDTGEEATSPVSMLIRVKTGEDADELLEKITHYKGKDEDK